MKGSESNELVQPIFSRGWGIAIPEGPFYLRSIDLVQQLSVLGVLAGRGENHQHMEVDFIQIIKGKEQ